MRCAPLTRLALALDSADPNAVGYAVAAERAQLDFVTLSGAAPSALDEVAAATSRIGVLGSRVATSSPGRSGVLVSDAAAPEIDVTTLDPAAVVAAEGSAAISGAALADVFLVAASATAAQVDALRDAAGARTVRVFADVAVLVDATPDGAQARAAAAVRDAHGDALIAGTPAEVMAELARRKAAAGLDGFRLHPADPELDIPVVLGALVPALREVDAFRRGYETRTLRGHLALPMPDRSPRLTA